MLVAGLSPTSAFHRNGKAWTLSDEVTAFGFELMARAWDEDPSERYIDHPDRPALPDRRRKTSDPGEINRFLMGR